MVNMTGVAQMLVGMSTTKYVLQQTVDPNIAQQITQLEGQPHSPQKYQLAVQATAEQHSSEFEQHNVAAGQHALAVVTHPAETASMCR